MGNIVWCLSWGPNEKQLLVREYVVGAGKGVLDKSNRRVEIEKKDGAEKM